MKKYLSLKIPQTYSQKIQWLKLHNTNPYYSRLVDKLQVRAIIAEKIGSNFLIPLLGIYDNFDEIDFDLLPDQFVLKTTHDSGSVFICKGKEKFNFEVAKSKLNKSLKRNYFYKSREYPYKSAIPRIIAERYMGNDSQSELNDYKFFCFSGKPLFFEATANKGANKARGFFNINLTAMPFKEKDNSSVHEIELPENISEMIRIAEILSIGMIHVRIDLYNIEGVIYFGEYTFHHCGGIVHFDPPEWDYRLGQLIKLPV